MEGSSFTELKGGDVQVSGSAWESWPFSLTSSPFPVPLSGGFLFWCWKTAPSKPEMPLQEKEKGESSGGTEQSLAEYTLLSILLWLLQFFTKLWFHLKTSPSVFSTLEWDGGKGVAWMGLIFLLGFKPAHTPTGESRWFHSVCDDD